MPDVSVVIPAYNQPQMLSESLRSVQEQTEPPAEVIVIDDCSGEPLEGVVTYSPRLPVRFVRHAHNEGPAASVVDGILNARCELITTLNHDDTWEPFFLERLGGALDANPEASFAFCDHGIMRADGERDEQLSLQQSRRFGRDGLADGVLRDGRLYQVALLHKAVAASSFALVRRGALDTALIGAGGDMWDYFLAVGACRSGDGAVYVAERLGWYRFSPTMLTTTWADPHKQVEMAREQVAILMVMLRTPQFKPIHRALRKRLMLTIRHVFAAAARTRSLATVGRVPVRIIAGARDGARLSARSGSSVSGGGPGAPRGLPGEL